MALRSFAALAPALLLTGCLDEPRSNLLRDGPTPERARTVAMRETNRAPATEAAGKRVISVGQKLLDGNPSLGMRPAFLTIGAPHPEIFHQGGGLRPYQVLISEGLANRCKGDDELAAVLAMQLGRMVAEREAARAPGRGEEGMPPAERIGNDDSATFGGPDGTRLMEAAKYGRKRGGKRTTPPKPETLAKNYLTGAGYPEAALAAVAPLLREAEDHDRLEGQLRAGPR